MNKLKLILITFISCMTFSRAQEIPWKGPSVSFSHGKLKISENKRFLIFEDGTPFFYLGDTGWELFHRLKKEEADYVVATRGDGYAFIYFPTGWSADIILDRIGATTISAHWYDPRTGGSKPIGIFPGSGTQKFTLPTAGRGNDWILILYDANRNFKTL